MYPLPQRVGIGSPYGADRDGGRRRHKGVDLFAPTGTPVYATSDGRILKSGFHSTAGNRVWLLGSGGNSFGFMHLDKIFVMEGQEVKAGQVIGTVGDTGNARGTSPHLHFEHKVMGANVDPARFLKTGEMASTPLVGDFSKQVVGPAIRFPNLPFSTWLKPPEAWEGYDEQGRKRIMEPPRAWAATTRPATSAGSRSEGSVQEMIRKAALDSGITNERDIQALMNLAREESRFTPGIPQKGGTARGLFQLEPFNWKYLPRGKASFGNAYEETIGAIGYLRSRTDYRGSPSKAWELWIQRGKQRGTGRGWY